MPPKLPSEPVSPSRKTRTLQWRGVGAVALAASRFRAKGRRQSSAAEGNRDRGDGDAPEAQRQVSFKRKLSRVPSSVQPPLSSAASLRLHRGSSVTSQMSTSPPLGGTRQPPHSPRRQSMRKLSSRRRSLLSFGFGTTLSGESSSISIASIETESIITPDALALETFADVHAGAVPTEAVAEALWTVQFFKARDLPLRMRYRQARKQLEAVERIRMAGFDDHHSGPVTARVEPTADMHTDRLYDWRRKFLAGLVVTLEDYLVDEAPPPNTLDALAGSKYWLTVKNVQERRRRCTVDEERDPVLRSTCLRFRRARCSASAAVASLLIAAAECCQSTDRHAASAAAGAAAIAVAAASLPPELPRRPSAWDLRRVTVTESRVEFVDAAMGFTVHFEQEGGALHATADGKKVKVESVKFDRETVSLVLPEAGVVMRPPFDGLAKLLRGLTALAKRCGVQHDLLAVDPLETSQSGLDDLPPASPTFGAAFLPGDPLGTNKRVERDYKQWRAKSPKCSPKGSPRGSCASSPRSEANLSPVQRHVSMQLAAAAARVARGSPKEADRKKRGKAKSLFDTVSTGAFSREVGKLKGLWDAMVDGLNSVAVWLSTAAVAEDVPSPADMLVSIQEAVRKEHRATAEGEMCRKAAQRVRAGADRLLSSLAEGRATRTPGGSPVAGLQADAQKLRARVEALEKEAVQLRRDRQEAVEHATQAEKQLRKAVQVVRAEKRARRQQQHLKDAVAMAEELASAVATMQLDKLSYLSRIVSPTPLESAFAQVAWMLGEYKSFLPHTLTDDADDSAPGSPGSPGMSPKRAPLGSPYRALGGSFDQRLLSVSLDGGRPVSSGGLSCTPARAPPEGSIAMCFTDIQGSTALWESSQRGMHGALKLHNDLMRRVLREHCGYEVKTIGDAFMVAFDSAADACGFALEMQEALVEEDWPAELLAIPSCMRVERGGAVLWCGLRVRFGIHFGPAELEWNPVTGRADYFGPTVNKAARVEAAACGGLVAVTSDVLAEIDGAAFTALGEPLVLDYGRVTLKGINEPTEIKGLLPRHLEGRREEVERKETPKTRQQEAPQGNVAMVFTDIQSSTKLWEASQTGMQHGLRLHNELFRQLVEDCNGYEVKTIGDAFMVCFATAKDACRFGLQAQCKLLEQDWPLDLLAVSDCMPKEVDGAMIWRGLRVRVGVHYGPAELERNPLTGRADYFGPTVNKAARVEAAACGGLVAVTSDVLAELDADAMADLCDPVVIEFGARQLKGVQGQTMLSGMLPSKLAGRRPDIKLQIDAKPAESGGGSESAQARHLRSGLRRARVTVAHVRAHFPVVDPRAARQAAASVVAAVDDAAGQCGGSFLHAFSSAFVVSWNSVGGTKCRDHAAQGKSFAHLLQERVAGGMGIQLHVGVASGEVLCGNIGTSRRRFQTIVGGCVELAAACALRASRSDQFCLVAAEAPMEPAELGPEAQLMARPLRPRGNQGSVLLSSRGLPMLNVGEVSPLPELTSCEVVGGGTVSFRLSGAGELRCALPGEDDGEDVPIGEVVVDRDPKGKTVVLRLPSLGRSFNVPDSVPDAFLAELAELAEAAGVRHNVAPQTSRTVHDGQQTLVVTRRPGEVLGVVTSDLIVTQIDTSGAAARAGIAVGMRIVAVNGRTLSSDEDGRIAVSTARGDVYFTVAASGTSPRTPHLDAASVASAPVWRRGKDEDRRPARPSSAPAGGRRAARTPAATAVTVQDAAGAGWQELLQAASSPETDRRRKRALDEMSRTSARFEGVRRWQGVSAQTKLVGQRPVLPGKWVEAATSAAMANARAGSAQLSAAALGKSMLLTTAADSADLERLKEESEAWRAAALQLTAQRAEDRAAAAEIASIMRDGDAVRVRLEAEVRTKRQTECKLERELAKVRRELEAVRKAAADRPAGRASPPRAKSPPSRPVSPPTSPALVTVIAKPKTPVQSSPQQPLVEVRGLRL